MNGPPGSGAAPGAFDEAAATFEGRPFPSEVEWIELAPPADLVAPDFVARTLQELLGPGPEQLATFAAPAPSADFVARTCAAVHRDRRARWRELYARYVAPEPSPFFVARTLQALRAAPGLVAGEAGTRRPVAAVLRTWALPVLAAAAVLFAAFLLPRLDRAGAQAMPIEVRATHAVPAVFGLAGAPSPLFAVLGELDRSAHPGALPDSGGDGLVLLLQTEAAR
jgi:hypothetical protein